MGQRLDRFLAGREGLELTRSRVKALILEGLVTMDGAAVTPSTRTVADAEVIVRIPPPAPAVAEAEEMELEVVYEDQHLAVINKPAGLVVHPAAGHPSGTLVNGLLHRFGDLPGADRHLRPGIVHRLDQDTTGLMAVARTEQAYHGLVELFKERDPARLDRRYRALAVGEFKEDEGRIETLYGRHPTKRKLFSSLVRSGKPAITSWRVVERFRGFTLLELRLTTGRTHQIRVHFADRGRPLVGDQTYGVKKGRGLPRAVAEFPRQALHAWRLAFRHPVTGERVEGESPLPEDMAGLTIFLRGL